MEFVHANTYSTVIRHVNVIDGPVLAHPGSATGKRFRLASLSVTFVLRAGDWTVQHLNVSGPVLKKDKTEGKDRYGGAARWGWEKHSEYAPVLKLIDAVRPEGEASLPFRLTRLESGELEEKA